MDSFRSIATMGPRSCLGISDQRELATLDRPDFLGGEMGRQVDNTEFEVSVGLSTIGSNYSHRSDPLVASKLRSALVGPLQKPRIQIGSTIKDTATGFHELRSGAVQAHSLKSSFADVEGFRHLALDQTADFGHCDCPQPYTSGVARAYCRNERTSRWDRIKREL